MNIFGWIRDLFGIQKDMYETKKTRLEIEKIEEEKRERLITPATLDDVKKYDANTRKLVGRIKHDRSCDFPLTLDEEEWNSLRRRLGRHHRREIVALIALGILIISGILYLLLW